MGAQASQPAGLAGIVPELELAITDAEAPRETAMPTVRLSLRAGAPKRFRIHGLMLDCQVRIAPRRRSYSDPDERERLRDLFGPPEQWAQSLQGLLWANVPVHVPGFHGSTEAGLDLPCSYDFEVSAARYLAALAEGEIPLEVLFSGTIVWAGEGGGQRLARIPLDLEARFDLPVAVWREAIDRHFPNSAWMRVSRQSLARLQAYRASEALPSWDAVLDSLLDGHGAGANGGGRP